MNTPSYNGGSLLIKNAIQYALFFDKILGQARYINEQLSKTKDLQARKTYLDEEISLNIDFQELQNILDGLSGKGLIKTLEQGSLQSLKDFVENLKKVPPRKRIFFSYIILIYAGFLGGGQKSRIDCI